MEEMVMVTLKRYEQLVANEEKLSLIADAYNRLESYNFDKTLPVFFGEKEGKPE